MTGADMRNQQTSSHRAEAFFPSYANASLSN
jgi:hypothetical protein